MEQQIFFFFINGHWINVILSASLGVHGAVDGPGCWASACWLEDLSKGWIPLLLTVIQRHTPLQILANVWCTPKMSFPSLMDQQLPLKSYFYDLENSTRCKCINSDRLKTLYSDRSCCFFDYCTRLCCINLNPPGVTASPVLTHRLGSTAQLVKRVWMWTYCLLCSDEVTLI